MEVGSLRNPAPSSVEVLVSRKLCVCEQFPPQSPRTIGPASKLAAIFPTMERSHSADATALAVVVATRSHLQAAPPVSLMVSGLAIDAR